MALFKRSVSTGFTRLVIGAAVITLSACSIAPPMAVDYDTQYNFTNLTHYRWASAEESKRHIEQSQKARKKTVTSTAKPSTQTVTKSHDLLKKRITRSVNEALAQNGLVLDPTKAKAMLVQDIVLKKHTVRETYFYDPYSIELDSRYHGYGHGRYRSCTSYAHCAHDSWFGMASVSTEREHARLLLALSLLDTQDQRMLWKGVIGLPFNKKGQSPEAYDVIINDRIRTLLAKLPPSLLAQSPAQESH